MHTSIDPHQAVATLERVDAVAERTRADLARMGSLRFPLVLFGLLTVLSTPFGQLSDGAGLGLFWAVAGPAGTLATARHFRRIERRAGLFGRHGRAWLAASVCFLVCTWLAGALLGIVGVCVVIAAGHVAFGLAARSPLVAGGAAALAVLTLALSGLPEATLLLVLPPVFGLAAVAAGLALPANDRRA